LDIQILNPTSGPGSAVKTEYGFARKYCKELWERYGNSVDLILHLGMADGWEFYSIERSGWKQGTVKSVDIGNGRETEPLEYYVLPDDIGQTIKDIPGPNPWGKDVPDQLWAGPGFDVDQIARDVQKKFNTKLGRKGQEAIEVLPHPDAGNYLCGFMTYESSAQAFVNRYSAKSVFCHVPGWRDAKRLGIGRDFVCSLIGQIASQQH
jgi:pyroglutamyl-peptidase